MTSSEPSCGVGRVGMLAHVALFWLGYVVVLVGTSQLKHMVPQSLESLIWGLASCALLWPGSWLFLRWENGRLSDVGLNMQATSILRLLLGLSIALMTFASILGVVALIAGGLTFQRSVTLSPSLVLLNLCSILALACMEELGFRGYALRRLTGAIGVWPAQLLVAAVFGLCHIAFGWPLSAVLLGVLPCALLFGVCAHRSGGLAMPLGVHAGLNLAQWMFSPGSSGVWQVVTADSSAELVSQVSPVVGAALTLAATGIVWRWGGGGRIAGRATSQSTAGD